LLIFKCDFTGFVWDFYTKAQSEFYDIFVALVARLSNQFSLLNVVIWIRSDNGKVFTDCRVAAFCLQKGIRHEFSAPYSQWQNGSAERMFQTILNLSVASLYQSGLVHSYWDGKTLYVLLFSASTELVSRKASIWRKASLRRFLALSACMPCLSLLA
jgi:transposase InsO family protein